MKIKTCRDKKWAHITEADWSFARSSFEEHPVYLSLIDIKSNDQDMIVISEIFLSDLSGPSSFKGDPFSLQDLFGEIEEKYCCICLTVLMQTV